MREEMVNRVARAMCSGDWLTDAKYWRLKARAAIAAMHGLHCLGCTEEECPGWVCDSALEPVDDDVDERVGEKAKLLK